MKNIILSFFILSSAFPVYAAETKKNSAVDFFSQQSNKKDNNYTYNPYETLLSGTIAFVIGNVGFYTTKSQVLKLGYSAIQTIGVVNFGKGLYNINTPNLEKELAQILSAKDNDPNVSKEFLSKKLIEIYAREQRAKRIALFYGSALLSTQYLINTFVGETPKELRNVYIFLGGVNLLIAGYAANSKSNYEEYYYGKSFDIKPTITLMPTGNSNSSFSLTPGFSITSSF